MYTPGLKVSSSTILTRVRELPILGEHKVKVGDSVSATQEVLLAKLPGEVEVIRIADRMGLEPIDIEGSVGVKVGDKISQGQLISSVKTFFGLFTTEFHSPTEGTVEFYTDTNAHLGVRLAPIPLSVNAYVSGTVSKIDEGKRVYIETRGSFAQGIFGVGGERQGEILSLGVPNEKIVEIADLSAVESSLANSIIVGGAAFSLAAIKFAAKHSASAIITGSIDATTLREYVGHEIGVSITGDEDVPLTLIVTEGFGNLPISKRISDLATNCAGQSASVNGATQVRAGAMRPELIVPDTNQASEQSEDEFDNLILSVGSKIRIIRVPYFGALAEVAELPHQPEEIESGAVVRVLRARIAGSGELVTVPRANVELI